MRILTFEELRPVKGITFSRQWVRKLVEDGKFPAPIKPGNAGLNGWIDSEIDDWIKAKIAERDAK